MIDPALIAIAAVTLGGLALWLGFFRPLIVGALLPEWPSQRRGGA
jgi:hypothetical protein